MRCAGGGVAAGSGARDDGTAPSHSSALPSPGAAFAGTGAPPALPRPRPRARPSAAASPRPAAGARGPAEVAPAATPPAHRVLLDRHGESVTANGTNVFHGTCRLSVEPSSTTQAPSKFRKKHSTVRLGIAAFKNSEARPSSARLWAAS